MFIWVAIEIGTPPGKTRIGDDVVLAVPFFTRVDRLLSLDDVDMTDTLSGDDVVLADEAACTVRVTRLVSSLEDVDIVDALSGDGVVLAPFAVRVARLVSSVGVLCCDDAILDGTAAAFTVAGSDGNNMNERTNSIASFQQLNALMHPHPHQ